MRNLQSWPGGAPLSPEQMEHVEQTTFSMVMQALTDYVQTATIIFREEVAQPQDIAKDVTREAMEAMGLPQLHERLYGKVDFKKAIYTFLPQAQPVALMLDAKAEKQNGDRTATIQMSQTSLRVKMQRGGQVTDERGRLEPFIQRGDLTLYVVTVFAKYIYQSTASGHQLRHITGICLPNGGLQERYNLDAADTIWRAGRKAPSRREDFPVRLSLVDLRRKAAWRVQDIQTPAAFDTI